MSQQIPRILVTGASGFVGPYLIAALKNHFGGEVICIDWSAGVKASTAKADEFLEIDITAKEELFAAMKNCRPTHIIHLAAISHVPTSQSNPQLTWNVNVLGALNLLESVKNQLNTNPRILLVSTSEVYGMGDGQPLREDSQLQPRNPYAATKCAMDLMGYQYSLSGLNIVRARPFNHIGPNQSPNFVIPAFASQIVGIEKGQPNELRVGNLEAARDFLDVRDVVRAYVEILLNDSVPSGEVFNICAGQSHKIADLLELMLSHTDKKINVVIDPEKFRPVDFPLVRGRSDKLRKLCGWEPELDIQQTLKDVLDFYRNR